MGYEVLYYAEWKTWQANPLGTDCKSAPAGGLSFEYDVSKSFWNNYPTYPPNFQVNNFASCYYGMYLAPICTMPLEIGASTLAADNTWTTSQYLGPNITTVARIKDDRNALHKSPVTYYHSNPNNQGFNTDPMMGSTSNIQVTPNRPLNNCTIALPPSNKNEIVVKDEANRTSLVLYPNPANDILNYEISSQNQDLSLNYILKVFDVSGQLLYSIPGNSENGIINISALAAGVYIIQLRFNNELRIARFVKQ